MAGSSPGFPEEILVPSRQRGRDTFLRVRLVYRHRPRDVKIVTHNGGNGIFFADMAIVPDADLVIVLMTNVIAEVRVANSLLRQVGMRFLAGDALPMIPDVVNIDAARLRPLAGTYRLPVMPAPSA